MDPQKFRSRICRVSEKKKKPQMQSPLAFPKIIQGRNFTIKIASRQNFSSYQITGSVTGFSFNTETI